MVPQYPVACVGAITQLKRERKLSRTGARNTSSGVLKWRCGCPFKVSLSRSGDLFTGFDTTCSFGKNLFLSRIFGPNTFSRTMDTGEKHRIRCYPSKRSRSKERHLSIERFSKNLPPKYAYLSPAYLLLISYLSFRYLMSALTHKPGFTPPLLSPS